MRVLLVEDEPSVTVGVERALRTEGHDVRSVANGRDGLDLALSGNFDLIILDIMLPGMNGYEVCRTARRRGVNSTIMMLSAKNGEWDVAEGLDLGADDYMTKPFSTVELLARVRARSRTAAEPRSDGWMFSNGDLALDPALRRCWRGSHEIDLTARETRLLTALFERIGKVVTNDELMDRAWDDGQVGDHNVVQVYVGRLRRKLDEPFGTSDIETIRGVGYRLRDRRSS
jgi:two-component system OmpR family response regulator